MIRKSILYIYLLALVVVNFLPSKAISALNNKDIFSFRLDYVLHALSFLGLVVLMKLAYRLSFRKYLRPSLLVLFIAILLAVMLEVIQLWVPSRTFNPVDMACNVAGALVGGVLLLIQSPLPDKVSQARFFSLPKDRDWHFTKPACRQAGGTNKSSLIEILSLVVPRNFQFP